jgi:hypothetical protein
LTGNLNVPRRDHNATLLADGRVLVAGGSDSPSFRNAEIYDPSSELWTVTGSMKVGRRWFGMTTLQDGTVLAGIYYLDSCELFDPATGTWRPSTETWQPTAPMQVCREGHSATLLDDGTVLAAGGGAERPPCDPEGGCTFYAQRSAEIFTPDPR